MSILFDARGNEFLGSLDQILGQTVTDARTASATLAALNAEAVADLSGHGVALVHVVSIGTQTLVFEGTVDGTNYFPLPALSIASGAFVALTTTTGLFAVTVGGYRRIRVRVSVQTAGSAVVFFRATVADYMIGALPKPSELSVTTNGGINAGVTTTIPAVAGLFHYITHLFISRITTTALAGTAVLTATTTNLPGGINFLVGNAIIAGGTNIDVQSSFPSPIKSSVAGVASTIVFPAPGAAVSWYARVHYYVGP